MAARVFRAAMVVLGVALAARLAWWSLSPLVPLLVWLAVLVAVYAVAFRG